MFKENDLSSFSSNNSTNFSHNISNLQNLKVKSLFVVNEKKVEMLEFLLENEFPFLVIDDMDLNIFNYLLKYTDDNSQKYVFVIFKFKFKEIIEMYLNS